MKLNFDKLVTEETINLYGKGLHGEDLEVIVKVLRDKDAAVKGLWLRNNNITLADGKFTDALANNKTLEELYLSRNNIGAEGVKCLAAALKVNTTLERLELTNNNVGDEGAKYLAEALKVNITLERIYLYGNNIGDEGAKYLARALMVNKTLQHIYLADNKIGDEGAKSIATALLLNQGIHLIYLENNMIGDEGADKLVEALEYNNTIETLWLEDNQISNSVLEKVDAIDTDRERKELTSQQRREINAMKDEDEEIADNVKAMVKQDIIITKKDEELLDEAIAMKDAKLKALEDGKEKLEQEISSKDKEIASLKAALFMSKQQELESKALHKRARTEIHAGNTALMQVKEEMVSAMDVQDNVVGALVRTEEARTRAEREKILVQERLVKVKQENQAKTQQLEGVEQDKNLIQERLVEVKMENEDMKNHIEMVTMEKMQLESDADFTKRVLTLENNELKTNLEIARVAAATYWQEKEEALLRAECPICNRSEHDTIVFVPCGHVMCSKCVCGEDNENGLLQAHVSSHCHTCKKKVKKKVRVHR